MGKMPRGGCSRNEPIDWIDGYVDKVCPVTEPKEILYPFLTPFRLYRDKNILPYAGGLYDQPALMMTVLLILEEADKEQQAKRSGGTGDVDK